MTTKEAGMLGLHDTPAAWALVFFVLLLVTIVGLVVTIVKRYTAPEHMAEMLVVATLFIAVIGGVVVANEESPLDQRDNRIQVQLDDAHIEFLGTEDWDRRVVVSVEACMASYEIQADSTVWPLAAGTGRVVSGCEGKVLDQLFIPAP